MVFITIIDVCVTDKISTSPTSPTESKLSLIDMHIEHIASRSTIHNQPLAI
jgi:hypothetical protein